MARVVEKKPDELECVDVAISITLAILWRRMGGRLESFRGTPEDAGVRQQPEHYTYPV